MSKPYIVVFSGVPGSSKSAVADHLSWNFRMGLLSNDSVRFEVKEDMRVENLSIREDLKFDNINQNGALEEYEKRIKERRNTLLSLGNSAIFDGSVDRRWDEVKEELQFHDFGWFMINMELSRGFLERLYIGTGRETFIPQLNAYLRDHEKFLEKYSADVTMAIIDETFRNRLAVAASGLRRFIGSQQ